MFTWVFGPVLTVVADGWPCHLDVKLAVGILFLLGIFTFFRRASCAGSSLTPFPNIAAA